MTDDLISRSALKEALMELEVVGGHRMYRKGCDHTLHGLVPEMIDAQPTVDAVEVCRCKDCVYYLEINRFCCHMDGMSTARDEMSFCSYGERRVDDATD